MNREIQAVGLDIGTSKVRCIIGEAADSGVMNIVGVGCADSRGLRRGIVTTTDAVAESIRRARQCVKETFALSVELGGSISGEHGIGYVKAAYLDMAVDAPTLEIMKAIKKVFDPNGILNPGKMFVQ